jgi:hypothetical protein
MHGKAFKTLIQHFQQVMQQFEAADDPVEKRLLLAYSRQIILQAKEIVMEQRKLKIPTVSSGFAS